MGEAAFMAIVEESKSVGDVVLVGGVEGMAFQVGASVQVRVVVFR